MTSNVPHLRIARPVSDLSSARRMYCRGLGLRVIATFDDHQGFDGVMLGVPGAGYHFELTHCRTHPVTATPTPEDLAVFYVPDPAEWNRICDDMLAAGFKRVAAFNPYWDRLGRTFEDFDGYRVVLQNASNDASCAKESDEGQHENRRT